MDTFPEPSPADLAAIEDEWPLITAELELLDVQLALMVGTGPVHDLDVRRLRRAQASVIRETLAHAQRRMTGRQAA